MLLDEGTWDQALAVLPQTIIEEIRRFRRWQDRTNALASRLVLRKVFKERGLPDDSLEHLERTRQGRPFLVGMPDFNISHCDGLLVCAIASEGELGIDVENVRPVSFDDFRTQFSDEEWRAIHRGSEPERHFFRLWTLKESLVKADGRGLGLDLLTIQHRHGIAILDGKQYHVRELELGAGFCAHVASREPITEVHIQWEEKWYQPSE
ncbi:4'-phosphopantetheinyl transferase superfamily protein [bacterium]|nr:4'-phosphopantetheinyl transferase superfamily protein [bacterium]